uniref:Probable immunity protein n=1 Tax=Loigolactobacillus rennini TaxID=238013 RepID=A0A1K2I5F4_9LACO|nr:probable immunity protein [Loigolactobacillus rennini]
MNKEQLLQQKRHGKATLHGLYNSLATNFQPGVSDIREALLGVYQKTDKLSDIEPIYNRLANYIYFTGITHQIHFTKEQDEYTAQIAKIGRSAMLRGGSWGGDYSYKEQFL